jgi:hypothetical protein
MSETIRTGIVGALEWEASMTGLRTSTWIWASAGTVALMGAMVACSLNPQPLPPFMPDDGGASATATDGSYLALDASGVLARPDAGTSMPATGGADAAASHDAGTAEGGRSSDAGSSDAAIDAEDGGGPADSTTDAAADGATDAAIDADDAPGEPD